VIAVGSMGVGRSLEPPLDADAIIAVGDASHLFAVDASFGAKVWRDRSNYEVYIKKQASD
jgi:hypothetical protein